MEGECDIESSNAGTSNKDETNESEYTNRATTCTSTPQKISIPITHTNGWADDCEDLSFSDDGEICQAFSQSKEFLYGSPSTEAISDVSHQGEEALSDVSYQDKSFNLNETEGEPDRNTPPPVKTSVKKLIQGAELLVKVERLGSKKDDPQGKNRSRKRKANPKSNKVRSRDGSVSSSENLKESCQSSQDACSDYTTGHESDGGWSTDSSDLGELGEIDDLPSKISRKSTKTLGSPSFTTELSPFPEFESATNKEVGSTLFNPELSPFSKSECAINKEGSPHKRRDLRKCVSDTTHSEMRHRRSRRKQDSHSTITSVSDTSVFGHNDSSLYVVCDVLSESDSKEDLIGKEYRKVLVFFSSYKKTKLLDNFVMQLWSISIVMYCQYK